MFAPRWAKAAVTYFVIGVGFGLYMSLARRHIFTSLHAHVNLLGWASMGLIAMFYRAFPALEKDRLAVATFWLYQIFFPMMMLGLYLGRLGQGAIAAPLVGFGGLFTAVAVVLFAVTVWRSVKTTATDRSHSTGKTDIAG